MANYVSQWWGLNIARSKFDSFEDMMKSITMFFEHINGIPESMKVVWRVSLMDILLDLDKQENQKEDLRSLLVRLVTKKNKRKWAAFFVNKRIPLLVMDWVFSQNRFKQIKKPKIRQKAFQRWKENVWSDYVNNITANGVKELLTHPIRAVLQQKYTILMNLTLQEFDDEFKNDFMRLGTNQILSKSSDRERDFPNNKLSSKPKNLKQVAANSNRNKQYGHVVSSLRKSYKQQTTNKQESESEDEEENEEKFQHFLTSNDLLSLSAEIIQ